MAFSNSFFNDRLYQNKSIPVFSTNEDKKIIQYLNKIYKKIRDNMSTGERLVIVVGENHYAHDSLFHESLIFFIASMAGMKSILVEGTAKEFQGWLTHSIKYRLLNIPKLATLAYLYGWKVKSMEKNSELPDDVRNQNMSDFISNDSESSLVILGMDHFHDVIGNLEKKGVSVIGFKAIPEGHELFVLPSPTQKIEMLNTLRRSYAIQLNEANQWELVGISTQVMHNPQAQTFNSEKKYTKKAIIGEMVIEDLNDKGIQIKIGDGNIKCNILTDTQIKYLHSRISLISNEVLFSENELPLTEKENIKQVPKLEGYLKYKEEPINTALYFCMNKMLSVGYANTCRLQNYLHYANDNDRDQPSIR